MKADTALVLTEGIGVNFATAGVDPRSALATGMHAAPGVFAVLVGSGMSRAAGIPTGWEVVEDLVRRIARAEGSDLDQLGLSPEEWWLTRPRSRLRYDTLLAELAPTDTARHHVLRAYFDPSPSQGGAALRTDAHDALAQLVASGRVKVVLTTNFDRLIERALDRVGVSAQVIASPAGVRGMIPLVHAPATVVKLHGDYASAGLRNTPEELAAYPPELTGLLSRVFDEYGLVVVGWSADYDTGLAEAMAAAPSRRYPVYWSSLRGHLREAATRLVAVRKATVIQTEGADEFLVDLVRRLERLDIIATRRSRPVPLRMLRHQPNHAGAPRGWAVLPLLQLRVAVEVGPATQDETGIIRPEHRDRILLALDSAGLTRRLARLSEAAPAGAKDGEPELPDLVEHWQPTPGGYQTTDFATYRLGGDGASGVAAIVEIATPSYSSGCALLSFDIAASLAEPISLEDTALILRDALLAATGPLLESVADLLPSDAAPTEAEAHIAAPDQDGIGRTRSNNLAARIDMAALGKPTRDLTPSMGFAARVIEPLTEHGAAEFVVEALEQMALVSGYIDPREALAALRGALGLPASK